MVLLLARLPGTPSFPLRVDVARNWYLIVQFALFVLGGGGLALLAGRDLCRNRDRVALLLVLWLGGTFLFAAVLNWTVSARNILPLAPAAGLLLSRAIQQRRRAGVAVPAVGVAAGLILSLAVGLTVSWADYSWANSVRSTAARIVGSYRDIRGRLWFQGHWGFQYYMEQAGGTAADSARFVLRRGDLLVTPRVNTNERQVRSTPVYTVQEQRSFQVIPFAWGSTNDPTYGSGFYSSVEGPVPFILGTAAPQGYDVLLCTSSLVP